MIKVKQLIVDHPDCLNNRNLLRSFLLDTFPDDKRTVNILTSIYECGIVDKLKDKKTVTNDDLNKFTNQLEREYGITPKIGWEYIMIWIEALSISHLNVKAPEEKSQINTNLVDFFETAGFEVIDKRPLGGCLWVVGEKRSIDPYVKIAKNIFNVLDGGYTKGRATGGRNGWYTTSEN